EPVLVEVMLGGPHRVVPEGVAVLGVGEEVRIDSPVVGLAVAPLVCRRPVNAGVRHVHGPVEEGAEMHHSLQGLRDGACWWLSRQQSPRRPHTLPDRSESPGGAEHDWRCPRYCATTLSRMHLWTAPGLRQAHLNLVGCGGDNRDPNQL